MAVAVMKKVPLAPEVSVAVRTFAENVAKVVLLENQVATAVISCPPLQVAVNVWLGSPCVRVTGLLGVTMGTLVQAIETTRGWLPLMDGSKFDAAVTVPEPELCAVTSPPVVTVAMG